MTKRDIFQRGDRCGAFEIEGRLRSGGMATLFLGRRDGAAGFSRKVVIKVIHPHLAERDHFVRMFIDEARICSRINHSNVVKVEEFGEHDGIYYMAMEYVEGCSLGQLLSSHARRGEPLSAEIAVHLALEVGAGLHAAHETVDDNGHPLGIVHRDVSPSNILITRDGRVKLIDFGVAKARGRLSGTRTGAGSLKGKIGYMSPEQAWGRDLDQLTDVYALGVVLWEMLTTRHLFRADDDLALLELVRNPSVPAPSTLNPAIRRELDRVVIRATASSEAHRPPTMQDLRRELMAAVPGAMSVQPELIAQLVAVVNGEVAAEQALPKTGRFRMPTSETRALADADVPATPSATAAGEVEHARVIPRLSRPVWIAIAAAAASALAIGAIVVTRDGDGRDVAGAAGARPAGPDPDVAPMPVEPTPITAAPKPESPPTAPLTAPQAAPETAPETAHQAPVPIKEPARKPPPRRRVPRARADVGGDGADEAEVKTVEIDGVMLADEPPEPTPPPPRRKKKP